MKRCIHFYCMSTPMQEYSILLYPNNLSLKFNQDFQWNPSLIHVCLKILLSLISSVHFIQTHFSKYVTNNKCTHDELVLGFDQPKDDDKYCSLHYLLYHTIPKTFDLIILWKSWITLLVLLVQSKDWFILPLMYNITFFRIYQQESSSNCLIHDTHWSFNTFWWLVLDTM